MVLQLQSTLSKDLILPASFHFLLKNINHKYPIYLVALYYSIDTSQNILNKVKKIILLNFMLQLQSTANNAVS